jgi:hypothetical protein
MEAEALKKILLYASAAVTLGIVLTFIPMITLTKIEAEDYCSLSGEYLSKGMERLENPYSLKTRGYPIDVLEIFIISFTIALATYVLFKFRISH